MSVIRKRSRNNKGKMRFGLVNTPNHCNNILNIGKKFENCCKNH